MHITIQLLTHERIYLEADPNATVYDIKHLLANDMEVDDDAIKYLVYNEENLDDDESISKYNINEQSVIVAVVLEHDMTIGDLLKINQTQDQNPDQNPDQNLDHNSHHDSDEEAELPELDETPFSVITEDDNKIIDEFVAMGFSKVQVIHNYFSCNKNYDLTLDMLLTDID